MGVRTDAPRATEDDALDRYFRLLGDLALADDTPLAVLLQRIVEAARTLLRARYAALGVTDEAGHVRRFFTAGLTRRERAAIGPLPEGAGMLGLIVRERRIVRAPVIARHPASAGFPPNHPPMTSFIGGPIALGERVYGNLYLADRLGAPEFSERDERWLALFARQAALAIEQAQRLARARQEERTIRALFEIGRALAALSDPAAVLALVAREARRLLAADLAGVALRQPDAATFRWVVVQGEGMPGVPEGALPLATTLAGQVMTSGEALVVPDLRAVGNADANPLLRDALVRGVLLVPLGTGRDARGALGVGWRAAGAPPNEAQGVLERLADRAAIALAQAELLTREQAALRQAHLERASLAAIFDSLEDAVYTTDPAGHVTRLNRQAAAWAGVGADAALGRPAAAVFPLVDAVGRPVGEPSAEAPAEEVFLRRPRGDPLPVQPATSPIRDAAGAVVGTVRVLRDLRARRQVEQLKATIISLVSHELRTPLAHIKGYASTLLQPDVDWDAETRRDFIAGIERQADRLGRLIGDLLEISRLDAGGAGQLERVPVAPATLIERGLRQAAPNATGHAIAVGVPDDLPAVSADPGHVERVVSNLVENAAKYSPAGAPIAVEAARRDGAVEFAVRDQGPGLSDEEQAHLFERFYRSPRVKHRTPGTGLGLAICKEIVEAHGGRIWAQSQEGQGSAFCFTLPVATTGGTP